MRQAAAKLDSLLGGFAEILVALLVVTETVILFAGVVARYALHSPLVWSDEAASILFLWLAMLGAVVAFRRGEHMRMTALVGMCSSSWRPFFEALATVAAFVFVILVLYPAFDYAAEERLIYERAARDLTLASALHE